MRETGIPFRQIHTPHKSWLTLARLTMVFRRWRPQIVLAAQFSDLLYAGIAGRLGRALILGGVRSDGWYELRSHGRLTRMMLGLTHGFVANSQHARRNLVSHGIAPETIEVLPNVIDLQDFDARSTLPLEVPLPPGRILVAAVGSLHPGKRFDRFLEALALARRREPALASKPTGRGSWNWMRDRMLDAGFGRWPGCGLAVLDAGPEAGQRVWCGRNPDNSRVSVAAGRPLPQHVGGGGRPRPRTGSDARYVSFRYFKMSSYAPPWFEYSA